MNILLVVADFDLGGAQQVVIYFANELTQNGHKVWIYDVYPELRKPGMINKLSKAASLISPDFQTKPNSLFEKIVNSFLYRTGIEKDFLKEKRLNEHKKSVKKIITEEKIDIINSHVWWADLFVFENLPELHKNWWITFHGTYLYLLKNPNNHSDFLRKGKLVIEAAKGVIYLSDEELLNVKRDFSPNLTNCYKVYNGIPTPKVNKKDRHVLGFENTDYIITCASRAIKEKGWEELIEAVEKLTAAHQNIKLLLIGDGPMFEVWKENFKDYQFVHFLGFREDVLDFIAISDLVVMPSYFSEAFPTILIEAISLGVPVVATNRGETKRIIENGDSHCGILLGVSPNVEEILNAIKLLIIDNVMYEQYKKNAVTNSNNFLIDRMVMSYENIFQNK